MKKRNCFAFPDKGEFTNWNNKAKELKTKGFKIEVSNLLEQTNFKNGFDLADYYFKTKKQKNKKMKKEKSLQKFTEIENLKSVSEVKENLINNTDSKSELCNSLSERLSDSYANELGKENVLKNMLIATLTDEIIIEDVRNTTYEQ